MSPEDYNDGAALTSKRLDKAERALLKAAHTEPNIILRERILSFAGSLADWREQVGR